MRKTRILRDKIRKKFRKFSTFCKLAGVDRYQMEVEFLKRDEVDNDIYEKYELLLESTAADGHVVDKKLLDTIAEAIRARGGMSEFCRDNRISRDTVNQIMAGKYKSISPAVEKVMFALGLKQFEV